MPFSFVTFDFPLVPWFIQLYFLDAVTPLGGGIPSYRLRSGAGRPGGRRHECAPWRVSPLRVASRCKTTSRGIQM